MDGELEMENKNVCDLIAKLASRIEAPEDYDILREIALEVGCDPEITGRRIDCEGRKVKKSKEPVPGTSKHRAQHATIWNGRCSTIS